MFPVVQHNNSIALNGFFGDLWNAFKRAVGVGRMDTDQANNGSIGSRIGGYLGRLLDKLTFSVAQDIFYRTGEYVPTYSQQLILNPIIEKLNNFCIGLVDEINLAIASNISGNAKLEIINDAFRKLQIVNSYYNQTPIVGISAQGMNYFLEQLDIMIESFELTIEETLLNSGISYQKNQISLSKKANDVYPITEVVNANINTLGIEYKALGTVTSIEPVLPSKPVLLDEVQPVNSTVQVPEKTKSNGKLIVGGLLLVTALAVAFSENDKKEKN